MNDHSDLVLYTCPSTRRPDNVPKMMEWYPDFLWVLADEQDVEEYQAQGAERIVLQPGEGLPDARNTCVHQAAEAGKYCLQVDDDLQSLVLGVGQRESIEPISLPDAVGEVLGAMHVTGAHLGGVYSSNNPYFAKPRIHTWAFCCAQFIVVTPWQDLWWDTDIDFKDDWELTCRHLKTYGKVARVDYIVPHALNSGGGGLSQHRTLMKDVQAAKKVIARYPDIVRKHPRRDGELQLIHTVKTMPETAKEAYRRANGSD